ASRPTFLTPMGLIQRVMIAPPGRARIPRINIQIPLISIIQCFPQSVTLVTQAIAWLPGWKGCVRLTLYAFARALHRGIAGFLSSAAVRLLAELDHQQIKRQFGGHAAALERAVDA